MSAALPAGITASTFNAVNGSITLSGSATLADYQTALQQIAYTYTSDAPNTALTRTVSFTVNDGNDNSNTVTRDIDVVAVNDAPMVSGPIIVTATEDDAPFSVDLLDGATDPDTGDTLSITNFAVNGNDAGIVRNGNSLEIDPNAYNSLAVIENEIIEISYTIEDGNGGSIAQTATITIDGVNDNPTLDFNGLDFGYRFTKILEPGDPGPEGGVFTTVGAAAISQGNLAIIGFVDGQRGVYAYIDGSVILIADEPGNPSISGENVTFRRTDKTIVFGYIDGILSVVADQNTPVPGGSGTFSLFASGHPRIDGDEVAFFAFSPSDSQGIYKTNDGVIETVVKIGTPAPGGGTFTNISGPDFDNGNVVFFADTSTGQTGV